MHKPIHSEYDKADRNNWSLPHCVQYLVVFSIHLSVVSNLIQFVQFDYFEKEMKLTHKIYYSPTPLNRYTRHILINHNEDVYNALSKVVDKLDQDEYWKTLLDQYGLSLPRGD